MQTAGKSLAENRRTLFQQMLHPNKVQRLFNLLHVNNTLIPTVGCLPRPCLAFMLS